MNIIATIGIHDILHKLFNCFLSVISFLFEYCLYFLKLSPSHHKGLVVCQITVLISLAWIVADNQIPFAVRFPIGVVGDINCGGNVFGGLSLAKK